MAEDIDWHLRTNAALWSLWVKNGITPGQEFVVDFHFYCPREDIAESFISSLTEAGFTVQKDIKRTLFFWKGYEIEASVKYSWTLAYLNERTLEFCKTADTCGFSFEGLGATMP